MKPSNLKQNSNHNNNSRRGSAIPTYKNMNMRAKMMIGSILRTGTSETLKMSCVCKSGQYPVDGSDEDNTFAKFSPSGTLELTVANPALIGKFNPGDVYYLDFTKVEK